MKRAINIFTWMATIGLIISLVSCGMGHQLNWASPQLAGVYICAASIGFGLIAAVLYGIDWIRRNVRVQ